MAIEFNPMRSMIFTDLAKEQYRHKLLKWHMLHVEDSISQFQPYVQKYSFYSALPVPPDGERFGVARFHLCEHYWLVNPFTPEFTNKAFSEIMPVEVLKWQNSIPDEEEQADQIPKPSFAQTDVFPYLEKDFNFASIFITDIPYSDNLTQYRGYIAKR